LRGRNVKRGSKRAEAARYIIADKGGMSALVRYHGGFAAARLSRAKHRRLEKVSGRARPPRSHICARRTVT